MALLDDIKEPEDVKKLPEKELLGLIGEVRSRIVDVTLKNGGHLASSLGAVELIVALLRVFDPRRDRVVFDVGHQAYAWKILTGRNARFETLRTEGGISGFPKMSESPYDHFGVGHSSTSLSAALGYAVARDLRGEKHHVVAVVGDGALINGESFEALNHAGSLNNPVIFILNDNAMSISPRVGGMALHLARLSTSALYKGTKNVVKSFCRRAFRTDRVYRRLERMKNAVKKALSRSNLFSDMGLTYWGPFDGHDEQELERVFALAKNYDGPLLIHVLTEKGKGYAPAEENPVAYHGVAAAGKAPASSASWSRAAAACIEDLAEKDPRVTILTPAMTEGCALNRLRAVFPRRFFDVGIAEEHMLTFAAGQAAGGLRPIACIYSTFLQRAMDQLVHDICLQRLPVILAVDRAGLVGEDGETHQGLFDMNWASAIPNLKVWAPYDGRSLKAAFKSAARCEGPSLIRYPRGSVVERLTPADVFETADSAFVNRNSSWCVAAAGSACQIARRAAELVDERGGEAPDLLYLNRVSPLPEEALARLDGKKLLVTAEEAYERGGLGEHLSLFCAERGLQCAVRAAALPAAFVAPGTPEQQRKRLGLTPERIVEFYERQMR